MRIVGVGVDITEVRRVKNAIEKWGSSFLERIFTKKELEFAYRHQSFYQHLAGRFAAKEAIFKALGDKEINWKDVEILSNSIGKPYCKLLNKKKDNLEIHLSISHIKNYAVAQAVITEKS
ncbi:MAG: holo-ACP synthase [Candidatus Omnitrophica bacterium]|nr:holo-ACP synthase [Candidatus Omnitrophota bacterium]MCM8800186.1 holo-ACP synthase [Candidatus Omnitrophota bacterium]